MSVFLADFDTQKLGRGFGCQIQLQALSLTLMTLTKQRKMN